ncbi:hypothetical protein OGM63_20120 [Plectonema radiosum NIES-515]|uniref:Transposase n=1 Tax=Plectonema radiosum NIES-515 TaxID=2986073 RepID=A0ABT3B349_9CYAN|nr:hypothetical protein [Plectonema radiosum]MCV3215786.1 hypothetical protein [Plectonema radiosum NIES-515]
MDCLVYCPSRKQEQNEKSPRGAIAALKGELETEKGFSSYGAIVEWLKKEHGQDIEYGTVYAWVQYRWLCETKSTAQPLL